NPLGRWGFESYTDEDEAADALTELERWMGIHSHTSIFVDKPRWLFIETAQESEGRHLLYIVDFSGLKMPLIQQTNEITVTYDVPDGMKLTSAVKFDPWNTDVTLAPIKKGNLIYEMKFSIERFTVIELTLAPEEKTQDKPIGTLVFADSLREEAAVSGLAFVLGKMRDPSLPEPWRYGVWTNVIDSGLNPERYAYGHMMTSEHMGLLLQTAACMGDKKAFEESLMFLRNLMFSQDYHVVNWAMNPVKKLPVLQQDVEGEPWRNGNAPLDDFRIVKGLLQGANTFGNVEAETLAGEILRGLYWTSVTDRDRDDEKDFPEYAGGLIGYAWNWEGTDDDSLSPHSRATGIGELDIDLIPIDYQDLEAIGKAVEIYPLWSTVFVSSLKLLLDAEIAIGGKPSGLFWNGLDNEKMQFTGDFENPDNNKGMNLKVIQILWTAISLAQATESQSDILDIEMKKASLEAAGRTLHFFKTFYGVYGRIPEYLTPEGLDVPDCTPTVSGCLEKELDNLFEGEARIYTLAARLALILSDGEFASKLIEDKILTDRIADPSHPFYGQIGVSTANENDAEAWNVLESVLTICQEASFK
ncbi:MAG: hypothetical protein FJ088_03435, partial [Deltaproteobacteria bacterium]|nr:hypothetical protein [Deltaproteobacteria bacterium]